MDINYLTFHFTILLVATICPVEVYGNEQKDIGARHICGTLFVKTWKLMCRLKRLSGRKKRSIEGGKIESTLGQLISYKSFWQKLMSGLIKQNKLRI